MLRWMTFLALDSSAPNMYEFGAPPNHPMQGHLCPVILEGQAEELIFIARHHSLCLILLSIMKT